MTVRSALERTSSLEGRSRLLSDGSAGGWYLDYGVKIDERRGDEVREMLA